MDEGITFDADQCGRVPLDTGQARSDPHGDRDLANGWSQPLVIRSPDTDDQAVLWERPTPLRRPRHKDLTPLTATAQGAFLNTGAGERGWRM